LGVNLVTSYASEALQQRPIVLLFLGLICTFFAVLLLKTIIFSSSTEVFRIRGALAFLTNKNRVQPVEILGYPFNEDFCKYLSAFLQENKAYRKLFFESPNETVSMNRFNPDDLNYFSTINSILEFMVLMKLDLHLNEKGNGVRS
jgi:hypothetical protein